MKKKTIVGLFIIVLICGITGLLIEGYQIQDAIFFSFIMFFGNYSDASSNILVNIARFGALLVTTTAILTLFEKTINKIKIELNAKKNDSIYVYGDNDIVGSFVKSCTGHVVQSAEFVDTSKYVLLSDDEDNLGFYNRYKDKLVDKEVYIKNNIFANTIKGKHHFFSFEEIAARTFYKNNSFLQLAYINGKPKKELNISIIGNNSLTEAVIYESVNINIFSPKQKVNYNLYGNFDHFYNEHINHKLLNISFIGNDYFTHLKSINESDVILFFDSYKELYKLIGSINKGNIYFFSKDNINEDQFINHLYGTNSNISLHFINYEKDLVNEDEIFNEKSINYAKQLNADYNEKQGYCSELSIDEQWQKLSSFHKTSNISSADYYKYTTIRLLEILTCKNYHDISEEDINKHIEQLANLEHIRWYNYHLFCNWSYAKKTDKDLKKHSCLVLYDKLSKEEQDKDRQQVFNMYLLDKNGK